MEDHPLLAHRLRQATKKTLQLSIINPFDDDLQMRVAHKAIVAPTAMPHMLAQVVKAAAAAKGAAIPDGVRGAVESVTVSEAAQKLAEGFVSGEKQAIFLGNLAQHHPAAAALHALAQALADITGARLGFLGEAANSVGGYVAGAVPFASPAGKNALQMLAEPLKAYLLLGVEAELDTCGRSARTVAALKQAELVVAMSAFQHRALEYARVAAHRPVHRNGRNVHQHRRHRRLSAASFSRWQRPAPRGRSCACWAISSVFPASIRIRLRRSARKRSATAMFMRSWITARRSPLFRRSPSLLPAAWSASAKSRCMRRIRSCAAHCRCRERMMPARQWRG